MQTVFIHSLAMSFGECKEWWQFHPRNSMNHTLPGYLRGRTYFIDAGILPTLSTAHTIATRVLSVTRITITSEICVDLSIHLVSVRTRRFEPTVSFQSYYHLFAKRHLAFSKLLDLSFIWDDWTIYYQYVGALYSGTPLVYWKGD